LEGITIGDEDAAPPLKIINGENKFITGFGKSTDKVKLLMDCRKLLIDDPLNSTKRPVP
jgi:chemotaxis signal transduction protein